MARAAWILRAGRDDEYEHQAIGQSVIALGWRRIGDLSGLSSLTAINRLVDDAYTEFSARSRRVYGVQLYAFRCRVQVGDYVVLLRGNTPDVAVGTVTGDYAYRPDKPAHHLRPVTWARTDVRRAEIGADLLTAPALTNIFKIGRTDATARLKAVIAGIDQTPSSEAPPLPAASTPSTAAVQAPLTALENLRRNLEYALSLATAGLHLQQLKVGSFEVCDVFRAAWVQTVAALDHWVHQEIHQRMVAIADTSPGPRTVEFERLKLPIALVEKIAARTLTVREAVDQHFPAAFGQRTFQQPNRISEGLGHVADVSQLWPRVADVLNEQAADNVSYTADDVKEQLRNVVLRRNKIAHENDEDPLNRPEKVPIDAASTTRIVQWIGQVTEAIVVVLDNPA